MEYTIKNGKTVIIRECVKSDAKKLLDYMNQVLTESDNLARDPGEFNMTLEQEETFIEKSASSPNGYFVLALCDNEIIGSANYYGSQLNRMKHKASLGISVSKKYHNQGVGSLLMKDMINQAKKQGLHKLELEVKEDNIYAIHLYEKLGFVHEGLHKDGIFVNGTYINLVSMGLLLR